MKRKCLYVEPANYFPKELRDFLFSDDEEDEIETKKTVKAKTKAKSTKKTTKK